VRGTWRARSQDKMKESPRPNSSTYTQIFVGRQEQKQACDLFPHCLASWGTLIPTLQERSPLMWSRQSINMEQLTEMASVGTTGQNAFCRCSVGVFQIKGGSLCIHPYALTRLGTITPTTISKEPLGQMERELLHVCLGPFWSLNF
jgi:hypothetical protein